MSKHYDFAKYQGAGNDFILIDDRAPSFPLNDQKLVQQLCHRKFGIGADGLILLQTDSTADFRMRIFNCDGSEAESCGNGLRCLMRFISDLGLPQKPYTIATANRIVHAEFLGEKISIQMGPARDLRLHLKIDEWTVHSVDTGVPHAVLFVSDLEKVDLKTIGPYLRHHPTFQPRGTNVNIASQQSDGSFRVRTFERGIEGEVLACGTGALAVGAIASEIYRSPSPVHIHFSGGELEIHYQNKELRMVGPAKRIFVGSF